MSWRSSENKQEQNHHGYKDCIGNSTRKTAKNLEKSKDHSLRDTEDKIKKMNFVSMVSTSSDSMNLVTKKIFLKLPCC